MNIYDFLSVLPIGKEVNIVLSKGNVAGYESRDFLLSYIWYCDNYYNIYLDEISKNSTIHRGIKEILSSRGEKNIKEYPIQERPSSVCSFINSNI